MLSSNIDVFNKVLKTYKELTREEDHSRRKVKRAEFKTSILTLPALFTKILITT